MAITSDNLKSKRGMVGGAVAALLVAGGVAAVVLPSSSNSSDRGSARTGGEGAPVVLAQMGEDPALTPPGGPPMGGPGAPVTGQQAPPPPAEKMPNSFSGAPPTYGGGGGGGAANPMGMGGDMGMGGFGGQPTTTTGSSADFSKLKPIQRGKVAAGYRKDPFDSRRIPKYEDPPVYSFLAPIRMASRPVPPLPPPSDNPDIRFGPLPPVPRRVAGILYNGSVSAILETGTPGAGAIVDVVSPGSTVPSGIPGVDDLTVVSIGATSVILRANDGRTVTVPLSAVPAAFADSFRNQNLPGGGMPGMGPGMGAPGGGPPPGMGPGGRPGNFGPTGGGRGRGAAPTDGD
jgi:hypothetical protein